MKWFIATGKLKKVFFKLEMFGMSPVVQTSNISSCQKTFQFSLQFHYGRSFGFLVINICNHGEHYEKPRIISNDLMGSHTNRRAEGQAGMTKVKSHFSQFCARA
jgi:hypothetical protein